MCKYVLWLTYFSVFSLLSSLLLLLLVRSQVVCLLIFNLQTCRLCKILMATKHTGKVTTHLKTMYLKKASGKYFSFFRC